METTQYLQKRYKKPLYWRRVEEILLSYPLLKEAVRQLEHEYPSCTPTYTEAPNRGNMNLSTTEKYAVRRANRPEKYFRTVWT
ncbi:hypothetical protein [Risungbinella massiliensis]|uniref:hypothetical protein n=1 Tax=Risungbinella massiliensis TaxID=1329796 RepID=UPI0005CBC96B|nr:hypothetical protein [Risungbinella massiliensis]